MTPWCGLDYHRAAIAAIQLPWGGNASRYNGKSWTTRGRKLGRLIWLTGLSGAGKTTLGCALEERLRREGRRVELLDGDTVRKHLCRGLGFSREDRDENIRRIAFVASLLARHGVIPIVAAISPYRAAREEARALIAKLHRGLCERAARGVRDARSQGPLPQGARGRSSRVLRALTILTSRRAAPEVECRTDIESVGESVEKIVRELVKRERSRAAAAPDRLR